MKLKDIRETFDDCWIIACCDDKEYHEKKGEITDELWERQVNVATASQNFDTGETEIACDLI